MRLWAKVRFGGENRGIEAAFLVNAFFQEFNANSSISVKGDEAILEVYFESQPPVRIVSAIRSCASFDLQYGEVHENFSVKEISHDSQNVPSPTLLDQQPEIEVAPNAISTSSKPTDVPDGTGAVENGSVPKEFLGFQHRARSYEEFKNLVMQWLGLNERSLEILRKALEFYELSNSFTWKSFQVYCESKDFKLSESSQSSIYQSLSRRFKNSSYKLTLIPLLKLIVEFRDFDFTQTDFKPVQLSIDLLNGQNKEPELSDSSEQQSPCPEHESTVSEEAVIQEFHTIPMTDKLKEALHTLDKMRPVQERITHILDAMGFNDSEIIGPEMRGTILQVANNAVSASNDDFENDKIAGATQKMVFSAFINDFVNRVSPDFPKVHLYDFLEELKEIVG